jgi:uncharacterized membrane protein required for colicin V production
MFLQKLGGRKFLMALICVSAGVAVDILSPNGLSAELAGLMAAIVAAFSAANYAVTKQHFQSKTSSEGEEIGAVPDTSQLEMKELLANIGEAIIQTKQSVDATKTLILGAIKAGEKR